MKLFDRPERRSPYGVTWYEDGQRKRRFFQSEYDRQEFVRAHMLGQDLKGFNFLEWQRWLDLKRECELAGTTPEKAVLGYIRASLGPDSTPVTLGELVAKFLDDRIAKGISDDHEVHLKGYLLKQMVPHFGADAQAGHITREQLELFLGVFDPNKNPITFKNHRSYTRAFFRWAVDEGYLVNNPAARIKPKPIPDVEIEFLSIEQARNLFEKNHHDAELCALMALQAFAGLRAENIKRLSRKDLRLNDRQIIIPAAKHKNRTRHLLEAHMVMPNLWPWLERADLNELFNPSTTLQKRYHYWKGKAFARAGVGEIKNALRHSFATYKCALDGEAGKAAFAMGHKTPSILWDHYKGLATRADAELYASILPPLVAIDDARDVLTA